MIPLASFAARALGKRMGKITTQQMGKVSLLTSYLIEIFKNHRLIKIFQKEVYEKIGKYDENYKIASDWKWTAQAIENNYQASIVDSVVFNFRGGKTVGRHHTKRVQFQRPRASMSRSSQIQIWIQIRRWYQVLGLVHGVTVCSMYPQACMLWPMEILDDAVLQQAECMARARLEAAAQILSTTAPPLPSLRRAPAEHVLPDGPRAPPLMELCSSPAPPQAAPRLSATCTSPRQTRVKRQKRRTTRLRGRSAK